MNEQQERADFEAWFQKRRQATWEAAGCHKDRGPTPSVNWALGDRYLLIEGWQAASAAMAELSEENAQLREQNTAVGEACASYEAENKRLREELALLIGQRTEMIREANALRAALAAQGVPADPCVTLWQAMNEAEKVGNRTDDKLIVEFLRRAGYCIAATPAPPQAQQAAYVPAFRTSLAYDVGFKDGKKAAECVDQFCACRGGPGAECPEGAAIAAQAQQAARDPVTVYTNRGIGASSGGNGNG